MGGKGLVKELATESGHEFPHLCGVEVWRRTSLVGACVGVVESLSPASERVRGVWS